jgi:hypothetical protein
VLCILSVTLFATKKSHPYRRNPTSTAAAQQEARYHDEAVGQQDAESLALVVLRSGELEKLHEGRMQTF